MCVEMYSRTCCQKNYIIQTYLPLIRPQEDGSCEMTCTLLIKEELLTKHLEYKYVIFSPNVMGKDECYEFLHSFTGYQYPDPNRYLHIDKTKCLHGGKSSILNSLPYVHSTIF